jgi:hypothetical protein
VSLCELLFVMLTLDDEDNANIRNVGKDLPSDMASHRRRPESSATMPLESQYLTLCSVLYSATLSIDRIVKRRLQVNVMWKCSICGMVLAGEIGGNGGQNLYRCHFVRHQSRTDWPGIEPASLR